MKPEMKGKSMKPGMKGKSVKPGKTKTFLAAIVAVFVAMPCLAWEMLAIEIIARAFPYVVIFPTMCIIEGGKDLFDAIDTDSCTNAVTSCWTPVSLDAWNRGENHCSIPWCFADVYGLDLGLACSSCGDLAGMQVNLFSAFSQNAYGLQCSGFLARSDGEADGIFVGGFASGARCLRGLQVSSLMTYAQETEGCQISLLNRTKEDLYGLQVGLGNVAGSVYGFQAGAVDRCDDLCGLQTGAINRCDDLYGLQIGAINLCDNLYGLQSGVLNASKKCGYGLQVGVGNIAKCGAMLQIGVVNYIKSPTALQVGLVNLVGEDCKLHGKGDSFRSCIAYPIINYAW